MLRCITIDKETLIASNCDKDTVRKLSKEKKIICPNCQSPVIFKPGKVMRPHFAHSNSECVITTNYEQETASHLKGKQVLHEWLEKKFPNADIEYEVYLPETGQIADVFVEHSEEGMEGLRWAFEFQHSPLNSTEWERRHELYKSAGIQDFWILDKARFLKFSKAKDITDARIRNDLEKTIYSRTGLCYFLDLESLEMTIDFTFTTSWRTVIVKGIERKNEYIYHDPIHHKTHIDNIRVRMNKKFKHGVLVYSEVEEQMKDQLTRVLYILEREQEKKAEEELQKKAKEKYLFAKETYGKEWTEVVWEFMKTNKPDFTDDILHLPEKDFFDKYEPVFEKHRSNIKEHSTFKESEDVLERLIGSLIYESSLSSFEFTSKQGGRSLKEYAKSIYQAKIDVVTYVYDTYKEDLEKLASMNFKFIKRKLDDINLMLTPWKNQPTAIEYAIEYKHLETREAADEHMKQVKEQIIDYNPFAKYGKG